VLVAREEELSKKEQEATLYTHPIKTMKEGEHCKAIEDDESDGYSDDFERSLNETDQGDQDMEDGSGGIDESSKRVIGEIQRVVSARSVGVGSDKVVDNSLELVDYGTGADRDRSILKKPRAGSDMSKGDMSKSSSVLNKSVNFNDSLVAEELVDMFMRAANPEVDQSLDQSIGLNDTNTSFQSYQYSEGEIPATPSPDKRMWQRR